MKSPGKTIVPGVALACLVLATPVYAQHGAESKDMRLVGHNDLQGRSAYQPVIHQHGSRWIAYVGHHGGVQANSLNGNKEDNGTSILDVTDPRQPKYLAHIPGEVEGEAARDAGHRAVDHDRAVGGASVGDDAVDAVGPEEAGA